MEELEEELTADNLVDHLAVPEDDGSGSSVRHSYDNITGIRH